MRTGPVPLLAALLLLALPAPTRAIFISEEMERADTEGLFDSEYFLDLLSFSSPAEWEELWERPGAGYRINGASLDATDLFIQQEARLPARLTERLRFRYDVEHRGDKDLVRLHQWLRLDLGPWNGLTAGLFGEPAFAKEDADIGVRLGWTPTEETRLSASLNAVDFNFNERGRTTASYSAKPYTISTEAAWQAGGHRLLAALEADLPLIRSVPDTKLLYGYRRTLMTLDWNLKGPELGWSAAWSYEAKHEAKDYQPGAARPSEDFRREVHSGGAAVSIRRGRNRWEGGSRVLFRRGHAVFPNGGGTDATYRRWEAMPYVRWRRTLRPWAVSETAFFLSAGENRTRRRGGPDELSPVVEAKLGLGMDFVLGLSRIGLYGTFDLDDLDRHAWDGGNMRAMVLF